MSSTSSPPVLVIEDNADTRHMIQTYLDFEGIHAIAVANGLEGLAAVRAHRPCLILLDLSMPIMDGFRFREEQLRLADGDLASIPIVILSALNDCQRHAQRMGAVDVIPKPIDFERLVSIVRRHHDHAPAE